MKRDFYNLETLHKKVHDGQENHTLKSRLLSCIGLDKQKFSA